MKREYEKPDFEFVDFSVEETISNDDIIDGDMELSGSFDF